MPIILFKIACWERVLVPEEMKDEILLMLESGEISSSNKLPYGEGECIFDGIVDNSTLFIDPIQNSGRATIEYISDESKPIWDNGDDSVT